MQVSRLAAATLGASIWIASFLSISAAIAFDDSGKTEQHVETVFAGLRSLKPMQAGKQYTARVSGEEETGKKERFLRRRTSQEIASKESPKDAPWWLVDSTSLRILSRNWLPTENSFQASGRVYWIGYCGPLSDYPVNDGRELREFYAKTLAAVPPSFLNRTLSRFNYNVDASLLDSDENYLNPRLEGFIREQSTIFATHNIKPEREVPITLKRGSDGYVSKLTYSKENGWTGLIGLKSGCSTSLLANFEQTVKRHEWHKSMPLKK